MKKQAYTMIAMLILFGSLAVSAKAQCDVTTIARIPFQFSAGKATLPAGEYELSCSVSGILKLRNTARKVGSVMIVISRINGVSRDRAELVFHRYGNRYFLAQSWPVGTAGLELPKTHDERRLEHELVSLKPKAETVSLKLQRPRHGTDRERER